MARVLITVHLGRHFYKFGHYDLDVLIELGHEVHIAANFKDEIDFYENKNIIKHQIDFERNPISNKHHIAYRQLKELLKRNYFDLIHTQSPTGGVITRLAAKETQKKGTKVIYTPHGFHFFKGSSPLNWIIYGNIEKRLSRITDCIITINNEDFYNANDYLRSKNVELIPGVGIDLKQYTPQNVETKKKLREKYNIPEEDFLLFYAAELIDRKNHIMLLKVMKKLKKTHPNVKLLLAGQGENQKLLENYINKNNLWNCILLGFRKDIPKILQISDVGVSSSKQEGLPVNVMEAIATGLPVIVTDCRGNRDLVDNGVNGFVVDINDHNTFMEKIKILYENESIRKKFSENSLEVIKKYSINNVKKKMRKIYSKYI